MNHFYLKEFILIFSLLKGRAVVNCILMKSFVFSDRTFFDRLSFLGFLYLIAIFYSPVLSPFKKFRQAFPRFRFGASFLVISLSLNFILAKFNLTFRFVTFAPWPEHTK